MADAFPFRDVSKTGVIYVMTEAQRQGYTEADPEWVNFGQGQPETGPLTGGPPRVTSIAIDARDLEYAPVAGIMELRAAVADHYNQLYRRGMKEQYSAENVCIGPGGRAVLTRAAACLGNVNLGHFLPDYTAYEELLGIFRNFNPIPILLEPETGYGFTAEQLRREIRGRGLGAILMSNPANPTGKVIHGEELARWVAAGRALGCALIFDEFYSRYLWDPNIDPEGDGISAAGHIESIESEPVLVINGLTKNWRYPGFRIAWALGPKTMIEAMASAGSFLDGGAVRFVQRAVVPLIDPAQTRAETLTLRRTFGDKRRILLEGLRKIGVTFELEPQGAFYAWGDISNLPRGYANGMEFFRGALNHQVIVVPGEFFDVDPGNRRRGRHGRFDNHVRFSFGAPVERLRRGLTKLEQMIGTI